MQQTTENTIVDSTPIVPTPKTAKAHPAHTCLIILTLVISLIAAISSSSIAYFYWQSLQQVETYEPLEEVVIEEIVEETPPVEFIAFGDYNLPINYSLETNNYDLTLFETDDNGLISYGDARFGIDVSQHQKEIDWNAVAEDGVSFAIIRLGYRGYGTEGLIRLDENFHKNMAEAKAAGLDVGVYFFSQATSVWETLEEAYFVLEHLEGYELDLPVVFNWEFIDNNNSARTNTMQGQCITLYNQVFNEQMQKAGYYSMTYFNQTLGYMYLDLDLLSDTPFWLASYRSVPTFYYDFQIWQYSDTGTINGIEGFVDLNLMLTDFTKKEDALEIEIADDTSEIVDINQAENTEILDDANTENNSAIIHEQ